MLPFTTSWFLSSTTRRHWCPLPFRAAVYKCVQVFRYRNGIKIHCFLLLYILLVGLCFNSKAIDCQFKWHATGLMIFCKQWEVFIWLEKWCQIQNNYNVLTFFINLFLCLLLSNLSKRKFGQVIARDSWIVWKRVAFSAELEVKIIIYIHLCVHTVLLLVLANT